MKEKIRILIVDDHAMVRLGLAEAIAREPDLRLVGEASNGEEALQVYEKSRPDVVTMDDRLPGQDGAECTAALCRKFPGARVILLSIYEGSEDIWRATQAGAVGYISKSAEIDEVLVAIRHAADDKAYFSAGMEEKLTSRCAQESLTARELEVLRQIVAGQSNKEIGQTLNMSQSTVKHHIEKIFSKLHVLDRTQATSAAIRRGIVHLE